MSGYSRNAVFSKIVDAILESYPNAYCSSVLEPVPPSFPAVYINEVSRHDIAKNIDLKYSDRQWFSTFQVQVFSNKPHGQMSEAQSIMDIVRETFRGIYYRQSLEQCVPNIDPSIYRLVAEFSRNIGSGDQIPN